jgi:hypothetical protein
MRGKRERGGMLVFWIGAHLASITHLALHLRRGRGCSPITSSERKEPDVSTLTHAIYRAWSAGGEPTRAPPRLVANVCLIRIPTARPPFTPVPRRQNGWPAGHNKRL